MPDMRIALPDEMHDGFIERLRRLLWLKRDHLDELNDRGVGMLNRAIISSFDDCVSLTMSPTDFARLRDLQHPKAAPTQPRRGTQEPKSAAQLLANPPPLSESTPHQGVGAANERRLLSRETPAGRGRRANRGLFTLNLAPFAY